MSRVSHGRVGFQRQTHSLTVDRPGPNIPEVSRAIPWPEVPAYPLLSLAAFGTFRASPIPCVADAGPARLVSSGRAAISLALSAMRLQPGDEILLPAYHSASMIAPALSLNLSPVFYRINENLSANIEDICSKLGPRSRVIIAVHYFGFPQDIRRISELCCANELALLEDCAHCFFGVVDGKPIGSIGTYSIASLSKFFPVARGGLCVFPGLETNGATIKATSIKEEISATAAALDKAIYYDRFLRLEPIVTRLHRWRDNRKNGKKQISTFTEQLSSPVRSDPIEALFGISEDDRLGRLPLFSRYVYALSSKDRIIRLRRRNYGRIVSALRDWAACRPLLTELPDNVVPYMIPLWIDALDKVFPRLEDVGFPMQRFGQFLWPGLDESVCRTSAAFSHHLLQIPCHQDLRDDEIAWMLETLVRVVDQY